MAEVGQYASILKQAMDKYVGDKYGHATPPPPYVTPYGIRTLDALLGGGIPSSAPVLISSTPETGKSTMSLQFGAIFQKVHPESLVVYINIEEASGGEASGHESQIANVTVQVDSVYHDITERVINFGMDISRFINKAVEINVKEVIEMITGLVEIKKNIQQKTGTEVRILIIWDSIAATPSSKDATAEKPEEIIGYKARELTLGLSKLKQVISMERVSFIVIDQVRANMKIEGPFSIGEKSVGDFGNFKAATSVSALQHHLRQWLFLSKGVMLKANDPLGVDGWITNIGTEKNKLAPSQYTIPLVFDKRYGVIPVLSEYVFMRDITKTEKKYWKVATKLVYPLCISTSANSKVLTVYDPDDKKKILYKSEKFMERKLIEKLNTDPTFNYWFNKAVEISVDQRIKVALFRDDPASIDRNEGSDVGGGSIHEAEPETPASIADQFSQEMDQQSEQASIEVNQGNPFTPPVTEDPAPVQNGGSLQPEYQGPVAEEQHDPALGGGMSTITTEVPPFANQ